MSDERDQSQETWRHPTVAEITASPGHWEVHASSGGVWARLGDNGAWFQPGTPVRTLIADEAPHAGQMVAERSRTADAGDPHPERGSVG